jgi:acyl-CoA reductase-like NAD-dependent aldehyde dehydrogenase
VNYIAGEWTPAHDAREYARTNPADSADLVGTFPDSGPHDARGAVRAATEAAKGWRASSAPARAAVLGQTAVLLRERSSEIGAALTREEGKPISRALAEVARAADVLDYFASSVFWPRGLTIASSRPGVTLSTVREPLGPVLLVTPFNFPLFLAALKLGPALAAGNTVVWKPSPHVPLVSIALMNALRDAGTPAGVVNLVLGRTAELGRTLVGEPGISAISFTGSTAVGLDVERGAAARHVRVQLEMGGKNVLVVGADCDLQLAAETACESSFGESGQKCTAAGLVVVDSRRADDFMAAVEQVLAGLSIGDGARPGTDVGPLIEQGSLTRAERLIERSVAEGAVVELDGCGTRTSSLELGHFMQPQILRLPPGPCALKQEESFAPILSLVVADDVLSTGLELIEASQLGLSAAILTNDLDAANEFAQRAPAGVVNINLPTTGVEFQASFGGWNLSGGPFPEAGERALDFYTRAKTIAMGRYRA